MVLRRGRGLRGRSPEWLYQYPHRQHGFGPNQHSARRGAGAAPPHVLVVADNQQHNVLGEKLRSMSWWTERFVTSVAVRSPAVNLWSHHVLERFVEDAQKDGLKLVLHLGDATDIACSGEFDVFVRSMQRATGNSIPWLMAPGNHDSALAGNINSYISKPPEKAFSDAYGNESFSWSGACSTPDGKSEALTKELLVQAYRQALEAQGITFTAAPPDTLKDDAENCTLSVGRAADAASPLGRMEFQAVHRHCARVGDAEDGYSGNVGAFIAQRLRLPGGATALLIDSSDTGLARATPYGFLVRNPAPWRMERDQSGDQGRSWCVSASSRAWKSMSAHPMRRRSVGGG
nr:metallophosphoesterase [Pyxidicoccus xibeiensis]